jgi:hypothetical protein
VSGLRFASFVLATLLLSSAAQAQSAWPGYQPQLLRWNEDYSAQCATSPVLGLLRLKCASLSPARDSRVVFGAEYRWRMDDYDPADLGLHGGGKFRSTQNRALLHADFHFNPDLRLFVQVGSASESGRPVRRPGDEDRFDLVQSFLDLNFATTSTRWRIRAGRQELPLGRFAAIRDSTNFRRTFDALRLDVTRNDDSLLATVAQVTRLRTGAFDNEPNSDDRFAALMLTHTLRGAKGFKLDFALLEHDNNQAVYQSGPGRERRRTLGVRFAGARDSWDLDAQASYQFGTFTSGVNAMDIDAWGAALEGGVTIKNIACSPRLAVRIDAAGGDRNPDDRELNTFDLPYPNLSYLSDAAIFAPRNVWNIQPFASAALNPQLTATLGIQLLWRLSRHDAIYSSANIPLMAPSDSGNFVASQPYLRLSWRPMPLVNVQASVEKAFAGDVPQRAGGHDELYEALSLSVEI